MIMGTGGSAGTIITAVSGPERCVEQKRKFLQQALAPLYPKGTAGQRVRGVRRELSEVMQDNCVFRETQASAGPRESGHRPQMSKIMHSHCIILDG
jgi:hypothetical protein